MTSKKCKCNSNSNSKCNSEVQQQAMTVKAND
jgi:hypothetical protein